MQPHCAIGEAALVLGGADAGLVAAAPAWPTQVVAGRVRGPGCILRLAQRQKAEQPPVATARSPISVRSPALAQAVRGVDETMNAMPDVRRGHGAMPETGGRQAAVTGYTQATITRPGPHACPFPQQTGYAHQDGSSRPPGD